MTSDNFLIYSVLAAVVPVILYVGLIYWADQYEKEPIWLLSAAFVWGAVPAALLALLLNTLFSLPFYFIFSESSADLASGGAIAPIVEEVTKGFVLFLILIVRRQELDSPLDGIIYGAMVGMGFAMVENVLYYTTYFAESGGVGWGELVMVRGVIFGLNHALYSSMTGLGIALARMSRSWLIRLGAPLLGLATAVMLHVVHNVSMFGGSWATFLTGLTFGWGGVLLTIVIIVMSLYQERRWMRLYLAEEIDLGTLTAEEYDTVSSAARRGRHRLQLLFGEGFRPYRLAGQRYRQLSELAYCKRHHAYVQDDASREAVLLLRRSILDLNADTPL
ncbi:MAG: PrsW family intramembrane metalloprotease [Candidatus Promineofilum sp.]|nr:PrsW family intramembrane metalloprotease [Promineifilum sp.]